MTWLEATSSDAHPVQVTDEELKTAVTIVAEKVKSSLKYLKKSFQNVLISRKKDN